MNLPKQVKIDITKINEDLSELINDYLAERYGYCTNSYCYSGTIVVNNIEWDKED